MDIVTDTLCLTYASWRHELDALGDLTRRMRGFIQNYVVSSTTSDGPFSTPSSLSSSLSPSLLSLSWLLKLVHHADEESDSEACLARTHHAAAAVLPSPAAVGMDCGDMLRVLFARIDNLLLMVRQNMRLSERTSSRAGEAQTLLFRATLYHEARALLQDVLNLVLGEGNAKITSHAGVQLNMLLYIEKNYLPQPAYEDDVADAFWKVSHDVKTLGLRTQSEDAWKPPACGEQDRDETFELDYMNGQRNEFRNFFRWQAHLQQRQRHYLLAEACDYAAASHLWLQIEKELVELTLPSTRDALAYGVLCTSAACGLWLQDNCLATEESPVPSWIYHAIEGAAVAKEEETCAVRAFLPQSDPVASGSEEFASMGGNRTTGGVGARFGDEKSVVGLLPTAAPRQLGVVYSALMSLATALEQTFGCLEEAVNFYELAGMCLIENSESWVLVECLSGDRNADGSVVGGESFTTASRTDPCPAPAEENATRGMMRMAAARLIKDPLALTNSLAQELRQHRQSTLAGLLTRYGINRQLRHDSSGTSSRGVTAFLKAFVEQNHLDSTDRSSTEDKLRIDSRDSKGDYHKGPTLSAAPPAPQQNLMTCLQQHLRHRQGIKFHDSINAGGHLHLFIRAMRKAAVVSAIVGDYPHTLLYTEAALNALFTEEQRIQGLGATTVPHLPGERSAESLALEHLLFFRPPSAPLWETRRRGEVLFCLGFTPEKAFLLVLRFLVLLVLDEGQLTGGADTWRSVDGEAKSGGDPVQSGPDLARRSEAAPHEGSKQGFPSKERTHPCGGGGPISTLVASLACLQALSALTAQTQRVEAACIVMDLSPSLFEPLDEAPDTEEGAVQGDSAAGGPSGPQKAPHYGYFPVPALLGQATLTPTSDDEPYAVDLPEGGELSIEGLDGVGPSDVIASAAYKLLKAHVLTHAPQSQPQPPQGDVPILSSTCPKESATQEVLTLREPTLAGGDGDARPSLFRCSQEGLRRERPKLANRAPCKCAREAPVSAVADHDSAVGKASGERRMYSDLLTDLMRGLDVLYKRSTQTCPLAGSFAEQDGPQGESSKEMESGHCKNQKGVQKIGSPCKEGLPGVDRCGDSNNTSGEGCLCNFSKTPGREPAGGHPANIPEAGVCMSSTHKVLSHDARTAKDVLTHQMEKLESLLVYLGLRNRVLLMLMRRLQRKWIYPSIASTPFTYPLPHRSERKH